MALNQHQQDAARIAALEAQVGAAIDYLEGAKRPLSLAAALTRADANYEATQALEARNDKLQATIRRLQEERIKC